MATMHKLSASCYSYFFKHITPLLTTDKLTFFNQFAGGDMLSQENMLKGEILNYQAQELIYAAR